MSYQNNLILSQTKETNYCDTAKTMENLARSTPTRHNDQFVDAVKPVLESLLSDLQRTTEVLRRSNQSGERNSVTKNCTTPTYGKKSNNCDFSNLEQKYSKNKSKNDFPSQNSSRNEFRSESTQQDASQLDSMLGSLQVDMDKHGIHTIPKGDCALCGKSIVGQVVIALGKMWHPEHYLCCHCGEEIGHRNFFERAGKAYCENDYHDLFSPRCAYCNGPIRNRCVTALDKTFHTEHFICNECGRPFGDEGFHEKDGQAYCKDDFYRIYAPKCQGCNQPIKNKFITALGTHWHSECFICQICSKPFNNASFFDHNGIPLCEQHYHEKRGSLCHQCKRPISGRCVSAMGKKFHPEHFVCMYCNRQLFRGTFKETNGKAFCQRCHDKFVKPIK